jgi:hypothetical protein
VLAAGALAFMLKGARRWGCRKVLEDIDAGFLAYLDSVLVQRTALELFAVRLEVATTELRAIGEDATIGGLRGMATASDDRSSNGEDGEHDDTTKHVAHTMDGSLCAGQTSDAAGHTNRQHSHMRPNRSASADELAGGWKVRRAAVAAARAVPEQSPCGADKRGWAGSAQVTISCATIGRMRRDSVTTLGDAMPIILAEFKRLGEDSRQEALSILERCYPRPAEQAPKGRKEPPKRSGRRFSDTSRQILDCLKNEGPGGPAVVSQRTGIKNTKQTMKRLKDRGHVRVEGRGHYHFVSYPPEMES